jgi:hypothetical protein
LIAGEHDSSLVLLVDYNIVIETMEEDRVIDAMVVVVELLDDYRVVSGLLEENIVEEYLPN